MSPGAGEAETERYLFGLESPSIRKGRSILPCGVHATNKRIFLVRSSFSMQILVVGAWACGFVLSLLGLAALIYLAMTESIDAAMAVGFPLEEAGLVILVIFGWVIQRHRNSSPVSIQELERREIYEIEKAEISNVEIKGSDFWTSKIKVYLKSGQTRSILFVSRGTLERARAIFPEPAMKG